MIGDNGQIKFLPRRFLVACCKVLFNNPLALCELAARAPYISAGQMVKEAWLPNDRVFTLDFNCHALM